MSDNGSLLFGRYLRGLLRVLAVVTAMTLFTCGAAHAADDDDDDDDGWAKDPTSASGSGVEMWPPTSIGWPPLLPDDHVVAKPIIPVGPPPGEVPVPASIESPPPPPIVPAHN